MLPISNSKHAFKPSGGGTKPELGNYKEKPLMSFQNIPKQYWNFPGLNENCKLLLQIAQYKIKTHYPQSLSGGQMLKMHVIVSFVKRLHMSTSFRVIVILVAFTLWPGKDGQMQSFYSMQCVT